MNDGRPIHGEPTWFEPSPLHDVAAAISRATEHERRVYVERMGTGWRWSLTHPGGPYPLLRIAARFLNVSHFGLVLGVRTVADQAILCEDPADPTLPLSWSFVTFDGPTDADEVERVILRELGKPDAAQGVTTTNLT